MVASLGTSDMLHLILINSLLMLVRRVSIMEYARTMILSQVSNIINCVVRVLESWNEGCDRNRGVYICE